MDKIASKKWGVTAVLLCVGVWALLRGYPHAQLIEAFIAVGGFLSIATAFAFSPSSLDAAETLAPLVAIVGCDGAGKSTLATDVTDVLGRQTNVAMCYLGLGSGEMGERIKRWPIVGRMLEAKLARKASQARTKGQKIPGAITALVIFAFSLSRRRRFRHALALRRQGVTVITDRYPQTEVAGFYDGPGLSAARAGGPFVAWLAKLERRMYEHMADYRPNLVIRLNVDADTAYARKPDHKYAALQAKVAVTPTLRFNGAPIVDLDSLAPYGDVRQKAIDLIQQRLDSVRHSELSAA